MAQGIPITPDQLREAARLQSQFWTLDKIADRIGVHPVSLSRALARYNRRAFQRMERRKAAEKAEQVAQLKTVAAEAFDAWLHSRTPKEVSRSSTTTGDRESATTTEETSTHHCDAALLGQTRGALADIRKVLGLDEREDAAIPTGADLDPAAAAAAIAEYLKVADAPKPPQP